MLSWSQGVLGLVSAAGASLVEEAQDCEADTA